MVVGSPTVNYCRRRTIRDLARAGERRDGLVGAVEVETGAGGDRQGGAGGQDIAGGISQAGVKIADRLRGAAAA